MSETVLIIAEVIVGIAFLGVLSAVITVIMTRMLGKGSRAMDILDERYARGELTREQYEQMREDLEVAASAETSLRAPTNDSRDMIEASRSRRVN